MRRRELKAVSARLAAFIKATNAEIAEVHDRLLVMHSRLGQLENEALTRQQQLATVVELTNTGFDSLRFSIRVIDEMARAVDRRLCHHDDAINGLADIVWPQHEVMVEQETPFVWTAPGLPNLEQFDNASLARVIEHPYVNHDYARLPSEELGDCWDGVLARNAAAEAARRLRIIGDDYEPIPRQPQPDNWVRARHIPVDEHLESDYDERNGDDGS